MTDSMAMEKPPDTKTRIALLAVREALLLLLSALEDYLGLPRTKDRTHSR